MIKTTRFCKTAHRALYSASNSVKPMSKVVCFPEAIPKEKAALSSCKSLKLMLSKGYIKHISPGIFSLMPLAIRCLEKLCLLVDQEMVKINGQKVLFPTLIEDTLLKTSGRWENNLIFKLKDRHSSDFCLGPTHEEIATSLMAKLRVSYKYLPILLYQMSMKFRDEMNPKLGLLRGREFLMKDMYTFDTSTENAEKTYAKVCGAYQSLFSKLEVETIKVRGSSGDIGGDSSHEFHFKSDTGEDEILYCTKCKEGINAELDDGTNLNCSKCASPYDRCNAIEVGHAFLLGERYSNPFEAKFDSPQHEFETLQMGCYGLGLTRILAASTEILSDDNNLRWPLAIAPYYVSVIPPKKGSKEESVSPLADCIAESFNSISGLGSNVILDDRTNFTIGKRVQEASAIGIPYAVVVGKRAQEDVPKLEVIDLYKDESFFFSHKETLSFFRNKFMKIS